MSRKATARLHVLLSRTAPTGVVIRRGPSKVVCTFGWNRSDDTFFVGQWLRGRVYERRADVSPDGKHLIYFAMNGRWDSETKGAWTAVSRAPYLKALVLLAKGDCWNGGGLFTRDRLYWLNDGYGHELLHDSSEVVRDRAFEPPSIGNNECLGVYFPRLVRDGWQLVRREKRSEQELVVFEKPLDGYWTLRKLAIATLNHPVGKGVYYDEHELESSRTGHRLAFPDWEWADADRDRLVWAESGMLYAAKVTSEGLKDVRTLRDFNSDEYSRLKAPY
jgi:hypothetical protein